MRLAVVGKGGVGKSIVTGTLARILARRGQRVLTFDSDTMPGLARSLGIEECTEPPLRDAAERPEGGRWQLKQGLDAVTAVQRYAREAPDGVLLLQIGKWGRAAKEDRRAYQASTRAYLSVVQEILEPDEFKDWTLVGDSAAGPRHIAGDYMPFAEVYVVLVEAGWQSVLTGRRVARLARMRKGRVLPVANKVRTGEDRDLIEERLGEPVFATIPFDPAIAESDRLGVPLIDHAPESPGTRAIERLVDRIEALRPERAERPGAAPDPAAP
jgi:CO dehydrogenase maturation factor